MSQSSDFFMSLKEYFSKSFFKDVLDVLIAFLIAFATYKALGFALGTDQPVLTVVSCSMVPTLHRGDIIVVKHVDWDEIVATGKWKDPNATILVYYQPYENKLIVHRAYKKFEENKTLMTWGDNNSHPDPWYVPYDWVKGEVVFKIPYLGYVRIFLGMLLGQDTGGCEDYVYVGYAN